MEYYWKIDGTKVSYVNAGDAEDAYCIDFAYRHFLKINNRLYAKDGIDYYPLNCDGDPLPIGNLNGIVAAGQTVLQLTHGNAKPIKKERYLFVAENRLLCLDEYMYVLRGKAYCRCNGELVIDDNLSWWIVDYENRIYLFRLINGRKEFVRSFERCFSNGLYLDRTSAWQIWDNELICIDSGTDCYEVRYDGKQDRLTFFCEYDNGEQGKESYVREYVNKNGRYVSA